MNQLSTTYQYTQNRLWFTGNASGYKVSLILVALRPWIAPAENNWVFWHLLAKAHLGQRISTPVHKLKPLNHFTKLTSIFLSFHWFEDPGQIWSDCILSLLRVKSSAADAPGHKKYGTKPSALVAMAPSQWPAYLHCEGLTGMENGLDGEVANP